LPALLAEQVHHLSVLNGQAVWLWVS